MRIWHIMALCGVLSAPVFAQTDYKQFLNDRGELDPVYTDNAIRDLYQDKLDVDTASTTYLTKDGGSGTYLTKTSATATYANYATTEELYLRKSSATATYAPLAGNRTFAGVTTMATTNVTGFTALGTGNTAIKIKFLASNTAGTEGGTATIAHGIDASKISSISVIVEQDVSSYVPPEYVRSAGYQYSWASNATNVYVYNHATNSENILGDVIRISIVYFE